MIIVLVFFKLISGNWLKLYNRHENNFCVFISGNNYSFNAAKYLWLHLAPVACTEGIFLPQDYTVVSGERIVK